LAKDQDSVWVTTKVFNVVPHPLKCDDEVHQADHSRLRKIRRKLTQIKKAKRTQPMTDRHHDNIVSASEIATVEYRVAARSRCVTTAVNGKQNSPFAAVLQSRSPNVQHQAVFAGSARQGGPADRSRVIIIAAGQWLRRATSPRKSITGARPWQRLLRRHKPVLAGGIYAVGYAAEYVDSVLRPPTKSAALCNGDGRGWLGTGFRDDQRCGSCCPGARSEKRILFQKRAA
jgi:hypothetical protein